MDEVERIELIAVSRDGRQESLTIEVDESADPATVMVTSPERLAAVYADRDLLGGLNKLRARLEADDLLLCCQGARPLVWPSGMARDMSNGRLAYPLRRFPPMTSLSLVDVLAPAQPSEIGTLEEQRQAVNAFFDTPSPLWLWALNRLIGLPYLAVEGWLLKRRWRRR